MDAGISAMLMARQMRPPFSFWSYPKRERAAPGVREKGALAATLHVRAKLLYGGRREMVPAGLRWLPDGRGGVRYRLDGGFPRRGCVLGRGARTHLTGSSFRAFRFATRYPGGRRGLCFRADVHIRPLHQFPRGTASGSEKRSRDNAMTTPTTSAPSATGRQLQKSQKSIACPKAGQNRRLHRSADPRRAEARTRRSASKRSFLLDRAQPVFFSTRGKRKWGVHPAGPAPCGSRSPRGRRTAARITLAPLVAASQQIVGSNAEVVRHFHQSRHIRIMPAALIILVLASTDFKNSSHLCLCLARLLAQLSDPLCKIFHAPPLDLQFNFVYIVNTKLNYDFGDDSS